MRDRRKSVVLVVAVMAMGMTLARAEEPSHQRLEPRFVPRKTVYTEIPDGSSRERAHLKFVQRSQVRLRDGVFISEGDDDLAGLQRVMEDYPDVQPSRLFSARSEDEYAREKERVEGMSGREQADKNLYYQLDYPEAMDSVALLNDLNELEIVELAYPEPLEGEEPTMHTPDFQPEQGYRTAAVAGVHADLANSVAGGRGENVQIIDIERFFNTDHEDLPSVTVYPNGDPFAVWSDSFNHGTAVLGEMFAVDNGFGVLGLAHQADAGFVSTAGGRANAIDVATANSEPGDVILLELQRAGPNGSCTNGSSPPQVNCAPEEWSPASYDAIVAATNGGIIVVAAAGNGRQDLDAPEYDPAFVDRPDSGAILVGAGTADDPDCGFPPPRGRRELDGSWGSNYGARVNLQGWGQCVMTTGYGSTHGSSGSNDAYAAGFNGTSSASPIVAAAAAIMSSVAIENGDPDGLSSTEVRALLVSTGTPQDTSPAANSGHIGPLPDLGAALGLLANLEHLGVSFVDPPDTIDVNTAVPLTVRHEVVNNGPIGEVEATLTTRVIVPPDCEVEPAQAEQTVALTEGVPTTVDVAVSVTCSAPSFHGFAADGFIDAPFDGQDPDESDNFDSRTSTVAVLAHADLAAQSIDLTELDAAGAGDLLVGQTFEFNAPFTLHNFGDNVNDLYHSPVDARASRSVFVPAGVSGSVRVAEHEAPATVRVDGGQNPSMAVNQPAGTDVSADGPVLITVEYDVPEMEVGSDRVLDAAFGLHCFEPGPHTIRFRAEVSPLDEHVVDPESGNDVSVDGRTIECATPVQVNIRPGNAQNTVNTNGKQKVPVATLTTIAGEYGHPLSFDAASIDHSTVRFGTAPALDGDGGAVPSPNVPSVQDSFEMEDHTKDGDLDLVLRFALPDTGIDAATTEACITGSYLDGEGLVRTFYGCDAVDAKA